MRKHTIITPAMCDCDKTSSRLCNICDGGLAMCSVCGQAEITLAAECPGPVRTPKDTVLEWVKRITRKRKRMIVRSFAGGQSMQQVSELFDVNIAAIEEVIRQAMP